MRETLTILADSLKLLRARKLFWIVMGISLFIGLLYASIGFYESGMSIGFGAYKQENPIVVKGSEEAKVFYLLVFTSFITPYWLGFLAVLLALLTSCSVFPELMREGSIETIVSKPVSRWKIFLVKYLGMLGFMAIPLALFCLIVFLALGIRVGVWKPEVFYAVPVLTFVYSIVYSMAVFVGVLTRSTLFALLSAALLWGSCYLVHAGEWWAYMFIFQTAELGVETDFETGQTTQHDGPVEPSEGGVKFYEFYRKVTWPLPKPRKVTLTLDRLIVFNDELGPLAGKSLLGLLSGGGETEVGMAAQKAMRERYSLSEVLIPSVLFQVVVLGFAGWKFSRRDF